MNSRELINQITTDDIIKIMGSLGVDVVRETNDFLIFPTICHNGSSNKLYYYKESKTFYCYSHCGNMSLFDVVMKIKQYEFKDAFKYVKTFSSGGGIHGFYKPYRKTSLGDVIIVPLPVINKPFLFKMYSDNIKLMKEWSAEGITESALRKFNIRFDMEGNRMIIPHMNQDGQCVGIRVRNFNPKDARRAKYMPLFYDDNCYSHPLGSNLYGLNISKDNIKKYKKCVVFESEKSCLKYESLYPNRNISVAICGSNFSDQQKKMLLDLGIEEVVLCLDRQYEYEDSEEGINWKNKIIKNLKGLTDYCRCSFVWDNDQDRLLEYKDSPIDKGKEIFEKLLKNRIQI